MAVPKSPRCCCVLERADPEAAHLALVSEMRAESFQKKKTSAPPAAGAEASELPLARCRDEPSSVCAPGWPWGDVGAVGWVGAGCLLLLSSKSLRKPSTEGAGGGTLVHNWSLTTKKTGAGKFP